MSFDTRVDIAIRGVRMARRSPAAAAPGRATTGT